MLGWIGDIERLTEENTTFRTVTFTGKHEQLTLMCLAPGEDIGREMHSDVDPKDPARPGLTRCRC